MQSMNSRIRFAVASLCFLASCGSNVARDTRDAGEEATGLRFYEAVDPQVGVPADARSPRELTGCGLAFRDEAGLTALLGTSHSPELVRRFVRHRARRLADSGCAWIVGPATGFSGHPAADLTLAHSAARGADEAGVHYLLDARGLDLGRRTHVDDLLRQGIVGIAVRPGQDCSALETSRFFVRPRGDPRSGSRDHDPRRRVDPPSPRARRCESRPA